MTDIPTTIPARAGTDQWPIISAVRYGTGTNPVEYIAIVDCGEGTPTHPYATVHLYLWPDRIKTRDGDYNLTWQQARRSLAERAGLIPTPQAEVVVFAKEPYASDEVSVFVDGRPADPQRPGVVVTTHVVYLDTDDEEDRWMVSAPRGIGHLSPAAQDQITAVIKQIAAERDIDLDRLSEEYDAQ